MRKPKETIIDDDVKICPHCEEEIDELDYNARFSETIKGSSWGKCDLEGGNVSNESQDTYSYDDWEEYDYDYECPKCNSSVGLDELIDKEVEVEAEREETADDFNKKCF